MSTNPIDPPVPPIEVALEETLHFDFPRSDIVLRSRDSHNFHVSKLYIVNSSPLLRELIQTVSDTSDVASGEEPEPLPIVELPDRGATLHGLLTFIFPVVPILPSTSDEIMELLAVAQKYQMDSVLSHVRGTIARQHPPFFRPETAFHLYFLAQKHELHQEAVQAARVTLRLQMVIEDLGDKLGFSDTMTGAYLYELWKYHERIRTDLKSGVPDFRNSRLPKGVKALRCSVPRYNVDNSFPRWLDNYIESIAGAPHLLNSIEFEDARAHHINEIVASYRGACSCANISSQLRRDFWEALAAFVDEAIERADSTLTLVIEEEIPQYSSDPSFVPLRLDVPDASIIVRSSDQVNFPTHKSVLAMNSPFFKDLLSLPQPPDDELIDGLPVVQLSEDASLLSSLFSLLYLPQRPVKPGSYEKAFALLATCQKYDMELVQLDIRDKVERGTFPAPDEAQAFSAYALASSLGLIPEMDHAAHLTLGQPMTFESLGEGLRSFKGEALCGLVRYRAKFK